jgi:trehalose/maltose hydrolase-like predicted phosphorylase
MIDTSRAGLVYIGGVHPAAQEGAWRVVVEGFCGFSMERGEFRASPRLPKGWKSVTFYAAQNGRTRRIQVTKTGYAVMPCYTKCRPLV